MKGEIARRSVSGDPIALIIAITSLACLVLGACGDEEPKGPVNFQQGSGSLTIIGEPVTTSLVLTVDDTALFGPATEGERNDFLDLTLRSVDGRMFLSMQLLVRGRGEVKFASFPPSETEEGRLTVLIGEACDAGMGDLLGRECLWYSTNFFSAECVARFQKVTNEQIIGTVECGSLGANCPGGTGVRDADGACADGERYEPISLEATLQLEEPLFQEEIEAHELPPLQAIYDRLDEKSIALLEELDRMMPRLLEGYNVPGASIALVHSGRLDWASAYGWAEVDEERHVGVETIFRVMSLSKPFTALAAMTLVEQGRLDLDAPIDQYLTRWHLPLAEFDASLVTARRLLSHTAGISGIGNVPPGTSLEDSLQGKAKGAVPATLQFPPGEFHYSDHGYSILQLAIEEIAGQPFAAFMETEILGRVMAFPACYAVTSDCEMDTAMGYETNEEHPGGKAHAPVETVTEQAAFGLNASAVAVGHFISAMLRGLDVQAAGPRFLGTQSIVDMLTPVITTNAVDLNGADSWGLGFGITHLEGGGLLVSHGGGGCCNKALLSFLPEEGEGIVILTNGTQGHMLIQHVQCAWLAWTTDESGEGCGSLYDVYTIPSDGGNSRRVLADAHAELLPRWSPDGTRLAYSSSRDFNQDVYSVSTTDWEEKRLTNNRALEASPAWSPDGSRIAFTRLDEGVTKIYLMKANGSGQKRLSESPGEELLPSWSPDGEQIAFVGNNEPGSEFGLWLIRSDGTELQSLGSSGLVGPPAWSPDGTAIAFSSDGDLYVWKLDGSAPMRLTNDHVPGTTSFDGSIDPAWSPDGMQIVFAAGEENNHDLFVINADGTGRRQLTSGPANDRVPSWSPDGTTVAFSSTLTAD